jgi:hypothetical protein
VWLEGGSDEVGRLPAAYQELMVRSTYRDRLARTELIEKSLQAFIDKGGDMPVLEKIMEASYDFEVGRLPDLCVCVCWGKWGL